MSELKLFLKENKIQQENIKYGVTKSILDKNGEAVEWELRPITTKENEANREMCMVKRGKGKQSTHEINASHFQKLSATTSVVFPNLNSKELQDSYGVMTAEDLLMELVNNAGEFNVLMEKIMELSGFSTLEEDIEEAKK